jgi:hypothetical protein
MTAPTDAENPNSKAMFLALTEVSRQVHIT